MRIVHVIDYFQPKIGYQEYYLSKFQRQMGYKVTVITSDRFYPFHDYDKNYKKILGERIRRVGIREELGVSVLRMPIFFEYKKSAKLIFRGLFSALSSMKPDVVHCHSLLSPVSLQVCFYKRRLGYKLIFDTHVADFNTNLDRSFITKAYKIFFLNSLLIPSIKKTAAGIFAIAEPERDFLVNHFSFTREKIKIIHLGVDVDFFNPLKFEKKDLRRKYGFWDKDIILIFAGRVVKGKGIDFLLCLLNKLREENLKLVLIGGGDKSYIDKLKLFIRKNNLKVFFFDFMERWKLAEFYSLSDVAIWPGDPSIAMLEAMSMGLPLVTPLWKATRYLTDNKAVVFFKKKSLASLSANLSKLVENKRRIIKMGKNAQKFIKNNLSWEKITKEVNDFYKNSKYWNKS